MSKLIEVKLVDLDCKLSILETSVGLGLEPRKWNYCSTEQIQSHTYLFHYVLNPGQTRKTKERTKETQEFASSSCWRSWALAWARPAHKITNKHYL